MMRSSLGKAGDQGSDSSKESRTRCGDRRYRVRRSDNRAGRDNGSSEWLPHKGQKSTGPDRTRDEIAADLRLRGKTIFEHEGERHAHELIRFRAETVDVAEKVNVDAESERITEHKCVTAKIHGKLLATIHGSVHHDVALQYAIQITKPQRRPGITRRGVGRVKESIHRVQIHRETAERDSRRPLREIQKEEVIRIERRRTPRIDRDLRNLVHEWAGSDLIDLILGKPVQISPVRGDIGHPPPGTFRTLPAVMRLLAFPAPKLL